MTRQKLMSFGQHLEELRWRLLISLAVVAASFFAAYGFFSYDLLKILRAPMEAVADQTITLRTLAPLEIFIVRLKVSLATAFVVGSPVAVYHVVAFVSPGLTRSELRCIKPALAGGLGCFVAGALACYFLVLPIFFEFFIGMNIAAGTQVTWSVGSVVHNTLMMLLAFGVGFELPMVVIFLTQLGIVTPQTLARRRAYALLIILIASAILTPPDVYTMLILGAPLYVLYELSIVLSRVFHKRRLRRVQG